MEEWRARRPPPCYRARGQRDCRSAWRRETIDVSSVQENGNAVLIAGPTASGKSALALELAQATGGLIINTDSMQVYRDLRVITARPTPEQEAVVPHRLYGHIDAAVNFSAGSWVVDAAKVLAEARAQHRLPIFVGGSGLYFKALTRGLSAVPPTPAVIREDVRARLERDGVEALHAELARRDPVSAGRLKPRAGSCRGHRAFADRLASRRIAAAVATGSISRAVSWPRSRATLCAHRLPFRNDAFVRRAGRGGRLGSAAARSAAAGDEGPWRAGADPASRGRAHARRGGRDRPR